MLVPLSWLKEFVDIDIPVELLAERLTLAGLEVGHIEYIGLPQTRVPGVTWPVSDHLVWDRERLLLGAIHEVKPHPNADRLVLAMVDYGGAELEQCVTGAPNLFDYKGLGPLAKPLWTVFAAEGAEVWDGHSEERKRMILKEKPLRGIPNRSMVCSEKELGMSESHEGIILMEEDPGFPPGTPIADVLGDIILEIELTPNLARTFSILGVAREVGALLGKPVRQPSYDFIAQGAPIAGEVSIDIRNVELNPRFTLALLRDVEIKPSPDWIQRRLKAVGQRPINNIVDITNYITFEIGQPLHAFDYDTLKERAGGVPTIITRLPEPGETLNTLDEAQRTLEPHNILVCDTAGVLSLGGVIGGAETEITDSTRTVLLEAANWNYINIRQTMQTQKVFTDAGTRFSRGVHPSQAILGVQRGIELMRQVSGGVVAQGIIDVYPQPIPAPQVELPIAEIERILGLAFSADQAAGILRGLGFDVAVSGDMLHVTAPDHRTDIGTGVVGQADLIEEIGRIYGYDRLPTTIIADAMPPQRSNTHLEFEELVRDLLVGLGLRENISYRLTTPESEALLLPPGAQPDGGIGVQRPDAYVRLANPIAADKAVMRHTLLAGLLETAQRNARYTNSQSVFEIGNVYYQGANLLPDEPRRLAIMLTGPRSVQSWTAGAGEYVDFFDLKGLVESLLDGLHIEKASFSRTQHPTFHPGRAAALYVGQRLIGTLGEVHPLVAHAYDLDAAHVIAAELDLDILLESAQVNHKVTPLVNTPPVLQDIALVVTDQTTAAQVQAVIEKAGGNLLRSVSLFDVYRGEPIPEGHKSLAYSLAYQAEDRTLTDTEVAKVHGKIVKAAERELNAKLRA